MKSYPGKVKVLLIMTSSLLLATLAGMALGLFAQIGLTAHLFSLLAPALGAQQAGFAMASVTAMAIAGRSFLGWAMPLHADRRLVAALRGPVDAFFEAVKVNADDTEVRENRLNLLASLRATLHQVAEFSKIEG